jgi:hypothetical protein
VKRAANAKVPGMSLPGMFKVQKKIDTTWAGEGIENIRR